MPLIFIYLFEVSVCLLIFYLLYQLAFKNLITFQVNRVYFLCAYFLSFAIPYWSLDVFPIYMQVMPAESLIVGDLNTEYFASGSQLNMTMLLTLAYWAVVLVLFVRTIKSIWSIVAQINMSQKQKYDNYTIVENAINDQTFTFFRYLFVPKSKPIADEVAAHEIIHMKQWHSVDIILSELVKIILWFNPIAYFLQSKVKLNHEFICDAFAASKSSPYTYAHYLSHFISRNHNIVLTSNFAYQLKNRILMLQRSVNSNRNLFKYISIIPAVLILLFFFSCEEYVVTEEVEQISNTDSNTQKVIVSDTIMVYNSETGKEEEKVVSREVDAILKIDTIVTFDYETYEETVRIERSYVPVDYANDKHIQFDDQKVNRKSYGVDTLSTLDFETGEWKNEIIQRIDPCYNFFWGNRILTSVQEISVAKAEDLIKQKLEILKVSKDESCERANSFKGRIVIVPPKKDPVVFRFNSRNNKLPNTLNVKSNLVEGTKLFIDNLEVNGSIKMDGVVITIK